MIRKILLYCALACVFILAIYPWVGGQFCASYRGVSIVRTLLSDPDPARYAGYAQNIDPKALGAAFMRAPEPFAVSVRNRDIPFLAYYKVRFMNSGDSYSFLARFSCVSREDFSILAIDRLPD